jgi:hypothetical protein
MRLILFISFLFLVSSTSAQTTEEFRTKLENLKNSALGGYRITDEANTEIENLITKGVEAYDQNKNRKNDIKKGFKKFLSELENHVITEGNNNSINMKDINKTKRKICPLYPFC